MSAGLFSVVVCTPDDGKFAALSANFADRMGDVPFEMVRIADARSMCEGYNRGVARSAGDVLVFTHDDVEVLTADLGATLRRHLDAFDLIGVAGTTRLVRPDWLGAGPPYIFGQVAHVDAAGFDVCIYGAPRPCVGGIQALDGVFVAARREVVERIPFDAERFDGFHLYDIDFSFSAHLGGFRVAVANDIVVIHGSGGAYDARWQVAARRFLEKHGDRLAPDDSRPFRFASVLARSREEVLEVTHPGYWSPGP